MITCTCVCLVIILSSVLHCTCTFTQYTGLTKELPLNVHLLTLQSLGNSSYLLRLEHQFEVDEGAWSEPVELSLAVSVY